MIQIRNSAEPTQRRSHGEVHRVFFNGHCSRLFATSLPLAKGLGMAEDSRATLALGWLLITIQRHMWTTSNSRLSQNRKQNERMQHNYTVICAAGEGSQTVQFLPT